MQPDESLAKIAATAKSYQRFFSDNDDENEEKLMSDGDDFARATLGPHNNFQWTASATASVSIRFLQQKENQN